MLFIVWNNLGAFNRLTTDGFHYFYAKIVRKIKKKLSSFYKVRPALLRGQDPLNLRFGLKR